MTNQPTAFKQVQVVPCAVRLEKEARGLYAFHDSVACPDCRKIDRGFLVYAGNTMFSGFTGYFPKPDTVIHPIPCYVTT